MTSKTISLTGSELEVTGLSGANAHIRNDSTSVVYAAKMPGVSAGADEVTPIPAGQSVSVRGIICGAVYLLGTGSVYIQSDDYVENPFSVSSGDSGGSGGSTEPENCELIRCEFWYIGGNKTVIDVSGAKYFGIRPNGSIGNKVATLNSDTYQNEELIYVTSDNGCYIREVPASGKIFVQEGNFVLYTSDSYAAIERACIAHLEGWTCIDRRDS